MPSDLSDEAATAQRSQRRRERNRRYRERLKARRAGHDEATNVSTPSEDAEDARRRQLRKERNRRYQERLKQRRAEQAGSTTTTNSPASTTSEDRSNDVRAASPSHPGPRPHDVGQGAPGRSKTRGPIHIHPSPVRFYVTRLRNLNDRLVAWGYTKKILRFGRKICDEYLEVAASDATTQADWIAKKERWIAEGDRMLDYVEDFVSHDLLDYSAEQSMAEHWKNLSSVALNVTYMMAVTQARVDMFKL